MNTVIVFCLIVLAEKYVKGQVKFYSVFDRQYGKT